jgi:hypothetical protein
MTDGQGLVKQEETTLSSRLRTTVAKGVELQTFWIRAKDYCTRGVHSEHPVVSFIPSN